MNHLCGVLFPAVFVEYSQCHWGCQPPFISSLSWYRTPQITAMLLWSLWKRRGVLPEAPSGTSGWGGVGWGGKWSLRSSTLNPRVDGAVGERSVFSCYYFCIPLVALEMNHTCQSFSPAKGGHVCLYRSAAYVAQLLSAEAVAGRGSFTLSLGNGTVGKQESEQHTLD